ncbi:MAG: hypothetical protein ACRCZE_00995 [Candidatus Altimarinota bacterium]
MTKSNKRSTPKEFCQKATDLNVAKLQREESAQQAESKQSLFPNVGKLKYLNSQAEIAVLVLHFRSELLKSCLVKTPHQKQLELEKEIDYLEEFNKVLIDMFDLGLPKIAEGRRVTPSMDTLAEWKRFLENYEKGWDKSGFFYNLFKLKFSGLKTKEDILDEYFTGIPNEVRDFLKLLEMLVRLKREAGIYAAQGRKPEANEMLEHIRSNISMVENIAISIEMKLATPNSEVNDIGESIINLVQLKRQQLAKRDHGTKELGEAILLGEITDTEIQATLDSKTGLIEFDQKLEESKLEKKEKEAKKETDLPE